MAKWADYLISAVHYAEINNKKFISQVKIHEDLGETVGISIIKKRQDVIEIIDKGYSIKTIIKSKDNKWNEGEDVRKVQINNNYYIRTDANTKETDNLENLPEF